jgi:hypothetical protein
MHMLPIGSSQPPGGCLEGVAVKMRVPTLGSPRRPVASAPAPGAVGAWTRFLLHRPTKMFIFAILYKGSTDALGHQLNAAASTVSEHELLMNTQCWVIYLYETGMNGAVKTVHWSEGGSWLARMNGILFETASRDEGAGSARQLLCLSVCLSVCL